MAINISSSSFAQEWGVGRDSRFNKMPNCDQSVNYELQHQQHRFFCCCCCPTPRSFLNTATTVRYTQHDEEEKIIRLTSAVSS